MRPVKVAIAAALRTDAAVSAATVPVLPSIELIGVTSERVNDGPMIRHAMNVEVTVSHATENGADELLDSIVRAVRGRLRDAEHSTRPIAQEGGEAALCVLGATRWSVSASDASSVIRGASVSVSAEVGE